MGDCNCCLYSKLLITPFTALPRAETILALVRSVFVSVQKFRFARSKFASNKDASLKFEFSKSPSRMSALPNLALLKLQSLAITLRRSAEIIFVPTNKLFDILAFLMLTFFIIASEKLQFIRFAWSKFTSKAWQWVKSQPRRFECSKFK